MKPIACREQIQILAAHYLKAAPHMPPSTWGLWAVEALELSGFMVPDHPQWTDPPFGPYLAWSDAWDRQGGSAPLFWGEVEPVDLGIVATGFSCLDVDQANDAP